MNELQESLNEHLSHKEDNFVIDNDNKADWALRKIKEHEQAIQEASDFSEEEIHKIEHWYAQIEKQRTDQMDYLQSLLAEYASKKRAEDPDFKSMKLPNGRFGFRKRPDRWEYDYERLIEHLKSSNMDDLIRVKEEPKKNDLRQVFEVVDGNVINPETGELVEGIEVREQGENFNVRTD